MPPSADKRAHLIHPPKSDFFQKKTAALIFIYQNRRMAVFSVLGRNMPPAVTAVFFIYRRARFQIITTL